MSNEESDDGSRKPEAKEGKSEEIFEVEKILGHSVTDNMLLLKVRWAGFGPEEDTWEPENDLEECASEVVAEYYRKLKVNDKTELIERLQKQMHKNTQKKRKRERSPSDDDDEYSDEDSSISKNKKKNKKKIKSETPTSSNTSKVPTKAALKSYDSSASGPVTPNNAKKAAMEIRDNRWLDSDESNDESNTPFPVSDIDMLRNKVKNKSTIATVHSSVKAVSEVTDIEAIVKRETSDSPQPNSSSSTLHSNKKSHGDTDASNGHSSELVKPGVPKASEGFWKVTGITRHTDEKNVKMKLILMTNSITGVQKVLTSKDAFKLDGWSLTKYLLDRCEF